MRGWSPLAAAFLTGFLASAGAAAQSQAADPASLPDLHEFLQEVRSRLHSDEFLLDQYTFNERYSERRLDSQGKVRKETAEVYEVYPSTEPGHTYRRLVEENGKTLGAAELAKEDRKQEQKEDKTAQDPVKQAARLEQRRRKEAEAVEELFRVYDIRLAGRETLDGRPAIVLTFEPRPGVRTETKVGKVLQKFAGRAWIDEQDRQLVRVDGRLIDDLSFGFGILARLKRGATASILRRKVNDEIWLPAEARFVGQARLLLFKAIRLDALSRYTDYKKFSVATESTVKPEDKQN